VQQLPFASSLGSLKEAAARCSRHYLPVPLIKRMVDALSAAKGNVLHWHFMDGQR